MSLSLLGFLAGCSAAEGRWLAGLLVLALVCCLGYLVLGILNVIRIVRGWCRDEAAPDLRMLSRAWLVLAGVGLLGVLILGPRPEARFEVALVGGLKATGGGPSVFPWALLLGPLFVGLLGVLARLTSKWPRSPGLRVTSLGALLLPILLGVSLWFIAFCRT